MSSTRFADAVLSLTLPRTLYLFSLEAIGGNDFAVRFEIQKEFSAGFHRRGSGGVMMGDDGEGMDVK